MKQHITEQVRNGLESLSREARDARLELTRLARPDPAINEALALLADVQLAARVAGAWIGAAPPPKRK